MQLPLHSKRHFGNPLLLRKAFYFLQPLKAWCQFSITGWEFCSAKLQKQVEHQHREQIAAWWQLWLCICCVLPREPDYGELQMAETETVFSSLNSAVLKQLLKSAASLQCLSVLMRNKQKHWRKKGEKPPACHRSVGVIGGSAGTVRYNLSRSVVSLPGCREHGLEIRCRDW